jgi:hypothetical protein
VKNQVGRDPVHDFTLTLSTGQVFKVSLRASMIPHLPGDEPGTISAERAREFVTGPGHLFPPRCFENKGDRSFLPRGAVVITDVETVHDSDYPDRRRGTVKGVVVPIRVDGNLRVWIGLMGNEDAGLRLDLKADVKATTEGVSRTIGRGFRNNVSAGRSRLHGARLNVIPLVLDDDIPDGAALEMTISARRTCSRMAGGTPQRGTARLWFDGPGRRGGSRFDAVVGAGGDPPVGPRTRTHVLRAGGSLSPERGTASDVLDLTVDSAGSCPDRPFVEFGSWTGFAHVE